MGNLLPPIYEKIPEIKSTGLDILFYKIDRPLCEVNELEVILSIEEAERARRYYNSLDRNRYIVQNGALRKILAKYVDCHARDVDIRIGTNGKPYLKDKNKTGIHFNTSRSDSFAAFAFCKIGKIGVDIERIRELPDMFEIAQRYFTNSEKHKINMSDERLRIKLFYKLWTRKEAVLKAHGKGLLLPLDSVDVDSGDDVAQPFKVQVENGTIAEEFWVLDIEGPGGYAVAVAAAGPFDAVAVRNLGER